MITREKIASTVDSVLTSANFKPYKVYQEFVDFFGENLVDFQETGRDEKSLSKVINSLATTFANDITTTDAELESHVKDSLRLNNFTTGPKKILVRWPSVTIKNERDNEILIKELYAQVMVTQDGKLYGSFGLNRADFPISHAYRGYMHSHVHSIPFDRPTEFQSSCLGDGPIRGTIAELNRSCDIDKWKLFCLELDRYVHVESLRGGPYHRMIEITPLRGAEFTPLGFAGYCNRIEWNFYRLDNSNRDSVKRFLKTITEEFVNFLIDSKILQFKFINGAYAIAQSDVDMIIAISDAFIDWYNIYSLSHSCPRYEGLLQKELLFKAIIRNGSLYVKNDMSGDSSRYLTSYRQAYQGKRICYFKGEPVTINIHSDLDEEIEVTDNNQITILNPNYISYITNKIVRFINSKNT